MKRVVVTMELPVKEAQEVLNHILISYGKYRVHFKMDDLDEV